MAIRERASERPEHDPGSTVTATIEGTRPLLVEIQALVAPSYLTSPRRMANGVSRERVNLILAVLEKRVGMSLANQDVYVNVAGGVRVEEPAVDLSIALAVASNFKEMPVDPKAVFLGEIGLSLTLASLRCALSGFGFRLGLGLLEPTLSGELVVAYE